MRSISMISGYDEAERIRRLEEQPQVPPAPSAVATKATFDTREKWLTSAAAILLPWFAAAGFPIELNTRYSCGWPSAGGTRRKDRAVGECWSHKNSKDGSYEIFISPYVCEPLDVMDVLIHEMCHAAVGVEAGHKAVYKRCASAIGLVGKMTSTDLGEPLKARLQPVLAELGAYPHAKLDGEGIPSEGGPKQGTRMIKIVCPQCAYQVRTTMKWINIGLPSCPQGHSMEAQEPTEENNVEAE